MDANLKHNCSLLQSGISTAASYLVLAVLTAQFACGIACANDLNSDREWRVAQASSPDRAQPCARELPLQTIAFSGLFPAIEDRIPVANFKSGQIVEIDPLTMPEPEARDFIHEIQALGARVSIYLVGGHCEIGPDCDSLPAAVRLGSTGSWNWDKSERRILNVTHPAVLNRIASGIESGWRLGANYIRIDNLHFPSGSSEARTPAQMKTIIDLGHDIEDRLRADGTIETERVTGLVAHNNLAAWKELIEDGQLRRPPIFLTSERTAQLAALPEYEGDERLKRGELSPRDVPDIQAGRQLAEHFQIPYTVMEFRRSHDLTHPEQTYELPQSYVDAIRALSGVTEAVVIPNESQYVGPGEVFWGGGPNTLAKTPDHAAPSMAGKACTLQALPG